jgi:hypothetical protein
MTRYERYMKRGGRLLSHKGHAEGIANCHSGARVIPNFRSVGARGSFEMISVAEESDLCINFRIDEAEESGPCLKAVRNPGHAAMASDNNPLILIVGGFRSPRLIRYCSFTQFQRLAHIQFGRMSALKHAGFCCRHDAHASRSFGVPIFHSGQSLARFIKPLRLH